MKDKGIGLGIFLISIGIIWGLVTLNIISLSVFASIFTLWPLILVVIGINIIFRNKYAIKTISWLLLLAVIIVYGYYNDKGWTIGNREVTGVSGNASIERTSDIERAELVLKVGGMKLDMDSDTTKLLDAEINDEYVKHNVDKDGSKSIITFSREGYNFINFGDESYRGSFHLNPDLPWDMDIKTGAVEGTLDLSNIRTDKLGMKVGAVSLKLILGSKSPDCEVDIKAGASKIEMTVPRDSGVKVEFKGALNNTNMDDLGWNKDGNTYTSSNYNSAGNKINVTCSVGAGNLDIVTK